MPIVATTNFCRDGLRFVNAYFDNGGNLAACHPNVLWQGECTAAEHTDTCMQTFHRKTFSLAPADVIRNLGLATLSAEARFAGLTTSLDDAIAFASARQATAAANIWAAQVQFLLARADALCATRLKKIIGLGCATTALLRDKWPLCTKVTLAHAHYCELYVAYAQRRHRLPRGHSPLLESTVSQVLAARGLPVELRGCVENFLFYEQ